jgi:hypothetical protein
LQGLSAAPAQAASLIKVGVEVPIDAGEDDVFILESGKDYPTLRIDIQIRNLMPRRTVLSEMQVAMFTEEVLAAVGRDVRRAGRVQLKAQGYLKEEE